MSRPTTRAQLLDAMDAAYAKLQESVARLPALAGWGDDLFTKGVVQWTGSTSVGAYAVSATSSHDAWATTLIRRVVAAAA